jgi:localization factor PodJL
MRNVPWHAKDGRSTAREAPAEAARRTGLSVGAAFAMIRKEIQELRRQTSRPQIEPAVFEQRLHELAEQIGAMQGLDGDGPVKDDFLAQLKVLLTQNLASLQQQVATTAAHAISGPAESIRRDVASLKEIQASVDRRTQDTFEAVYGTIERIVDRLATIEEELRDRNPAAAADPAALPDDSDAPEAPNAPEASGAPETDDDDPAWAGLPARQPAAAPGTGLVAAARGALMLRQPAVLPDESAADAAQKLPSVNDADGATARSSEGCDDDEGPAVRRAAKAGAARMNRKVAMIAVAAVLLVLFAAGFALDLYRSPVESAPDAVPVTTAVIEPEPDHTTSNPRGGGETPAETPQIPPATPVTPPPVSDGIAPAAVVPADPPAAATAAPSDSAPWDLEALMRNVLLPATARAGWPQSGPPPGTDPAAAALPLPPPIGGKMLIAAAQAGDPGAAYEVATRFMQSRNPAPDYAKAAAWFDRAAQAGLAPAQFRLAGLYEKGHGIRKNFSEARRLYMAAAAQGHAKAMHNLAVLYTRGINGAPDYAAAVEWFRKAAVYGTIDSMYNLGILYARGTGIDRDLVESYKWFTLASKNGDKDAGRKRDEVAKALDPAQIESAKAAAEAFTVTPQPEEATAVRAPAGGWDQATATATTKTRTPTRRQSVSTDR